MDPILQQEEQRRLRVQLMWRLGFAIALIAAVLGVIIWLDQDKANAPAIEASMPMRIAPPLTEIASEPVSTASEPQEASTTAIAASVPTELPVEPSPTPAPTATVIPTLAPSPAPSKAPTSIATAKPQATQISQPAASKIAQPIHPSVQPPRIEAPQKPVVQQPATPKISTVNQPTPPARAATPTVSGKDYTIQAGSFLHASNAEKLLSQLQSAGIPAYLETRVQIGPFASKAEAEAAMAKLKSMGIKPVLIAPGK